MEKEANGLIVDTMLAFIIKHDIIEDTLKFLNELIEIYKKKSPYFKFKKIKNKPKCCQYLLSYLHFAGIIEKYSRNGGWKIVDYNALKRIYLNLQKCYVDDKEREKMRMKYSGDIIYSSMQSIMYSIGRMIGIKEKCPPVEAITSILIAYYIENYGEDEFIKEILRKLETIKKVVELENKVMT